MYIAVDLGSTNIKAATYDDTLHLLCMKSRPVSYIRESGFVEFDACTYCEELYSLLKDLTQTVKDPVQLALTGQAESLVVLDSSGKPLMNAISWMDERSREECQYLSQKFSPNLVETVTGQQAILPTWPATKILWLKRNRPDVFQAAAKYMLLKDYVVYWLTGLQFADMSIATFTLYFDIYNKCYWTQMLDVIGIHADQLPPLIEPCTTIGPLRTNLTEDLGLKNTILVNIGTLDHFAGMIGTGNTAPGTVTLSTGTVMALAAMTSEPTPKNCGTAMHYGFLPDTHVMLPVAESGGVSLEWFRRTCLGQMDYDTLNHQLASRTPSQLIFLPYLVGTNAPEFDPDATGVFWGLRQEHDALDMARSVMEGVCFVLRKNTEDICAKGTPLHTIIATGGGAKSPLWCQMQADITGLKVLVPAEKEAACLGAAMIAAVSCGIYRNYEEAAQAAVTFSHEYLPHPDQNHIHKYRRFCALYQMSSKIAKTD